jgi:hypothetical protein
MTEAQTAAEFVDSFDGFESYLELGESYGLAPDECTRDILI